MSQPEEVQLQRKIAGVEGKMKQSRHGSSMRRQAATRGVVFLIFAMVVAVTQAVHPALEKTEVEFRKSSVPLDLYKKFYFFNVTNAANVTNKGHIPGVVQCGPYAYRENQTRFNLKWNKNETLVTYDLNVTYTFDANQSPGDPTRDNITTVNIPLYVFLLKLEQLEQSDLPHWLQDLLDEAIKLFEKVISDFADYDGLFMKVKVQDLLFGYNDPLLEELKKIIDDLPEPIRKYLPAINPFFGLENVTEVVRNNTIYTGKDNSSKLGEYVVWNGNTEIFAHGGWGSPLAKMINGTDGFVFHSKVSQHENLTAFLSELYRSVYFTFKNATPHGPTLYRYGLPALELLNTTQDPGFYPNGPSGVFNLTAVFPNGAPMFASKPHFLDADPTYIANVSGLHPNRTLHDSYWDVEPNTGAVYRVAKRIQFNMRLTSCSMLSPLKNLMPEVMLPVYWTSEEGQLTSSKMVAPETHRHG